MHRTGFIKGFGLKSGAIASSISKDPRTLVAVGVGPVEIAGAINQLVEQGGGLVACGPAGKASLELPIAGLLSNLPASEVVKNRKGSMRSSKEWDVN